MGWAGCESGESRPHHFIRQWHFWEMDEFLPVIRSKDGKSRLGSHHPGSAGSVFSRYRAPTGRPVRTNAPLTDSKEQCQHRRYWNCRGWGYS
ncbi:hypothetical protein CKAH01_10986 [Colletotrichum kahawae]|uniref:Uncharacterized protein n=1 Tax=Colletotrichum kahawae TaxID=34407 RepID=A0AAD9XW01_COLKA|nr:hypothetical protein CKAH01_10986 [Colletotrichum kahawae]